MTLRRCGYGRAWAMLALALALTGCETWFGEVEAPPLQGERVPVLLHHSTLEPDPSLASQEVVLPRPVKNPEWPMSGGYANHAMHHLWIPDSLQRAWSTRIGTATDSEQPRLPPPVVYGGRIFAMDAEHRVSAYDVADGKRVWRTSLVPEDEEDLIVGGIAAESGRVFATAGFAEVISLDAGTGAEVWRTNVDAPIHAPPTVRDGRVFAVTLNNTLYALDAGTGEEQWTYKGIAEVAAIIGGGAPAVDGTTVVAPFSSGDLVALTTESGRVLWEDSLASRRRTDELARISQIHASPVIDRGRVYAVSNGGVMVCVDLRIGRRVWDASVGGLNRPWVAGDYVYVLTDDNEVATLNRNTGRVHWISRLPVWKDPEDHEGRILWSGPVLVGDRLVLTGSDGNVLAVSPYTGRLLGEIDISEDVSVPPVVADGTLYFLTDRGSLVAYR